MMAAGSAAVLLAIAVGGWLALHRTRTGTATPAGLVVTNSAVFRYQHRGDPPAPQSLTVTGSPGQGFVVRPGAAWIKVEPASGSISDLSSPVTIQVSVEPGDLSAGSYSGEVKIEGTQPGSSARNIGVNLQVTGAPVVEEPGPRVTPDTAKEEPRKEAPKNPEAAPLLRVDPPSLALRAKTGERATSSIAVACNPGAV